MPHTTHCLTSRQDVKLNSIKTSHGINAITSNKRFTHMLAGHMTLQASNTHVTMSDSQTAQSLIFLAKITEKSAFPT